MGVALNKHCVKKLSRIIIKNELIKNKYECRCVYKKYCEKYFDRIKPLPMFTRWFKLWPSCDQQQIHAPLCP